MHVCIVLQVLLDMLGLDELSDFLKLMCSSSSTASSKRELQGSSSTHAGAMRPSTSATARSAAAASGTAASTVGAVSFKSAGITAALGHGVASVLAAVSPHSMQRTFCHANHLDVKAGCKCTCHMAQ